MTLTQPIDPPTPSPPARTISRRRKAAMVVQLLLKEGAPLGLSQLPEDLQLQLTRELGGLKVIDHTTLNTVIEEFSRELEQVALTAPDGVEAALAALSDTLSPRAAARLREENARAKGGDPWQQVLALEVPDLVSLMETESTEVCAVALSKLPVARAAEVLGKLPGERARRITYAVSQTGAVTPDAVARIGASLAADYSNRPMPAFDVHPSQRIGAILNSSGADTRDALLEALGTDDPALADEVRKAIFTFPDIPARLLPNDVPKVIREVEGAALVTALAYSVSVGGDSAAAVDFILSNMSQRMADQLREEMGERGKIKKSDGEGAQALLIGAIRAKADAGDITLIEAEEDED
ncbi:flagellar motor switch protein FliG [Loktanella sp. IMCC34160]|uniref:flagellar motor switch protein FliG n=1 Tax=Loktanella sp. IMCC34160 TaxID=2510646 RepID=UPI00101CA88A|nr:FliG C-terminal domain-containing protein [Loktanella sp. IMCC34160]RYG91890.1 flagellar motor switch protein FliG [Loktanella sp. IMCC34160]